MDRTPIRIVMVTSPNKQCGVREYSDILAETIRGGWKDHLDLFGSDKINYPESLKMWEQSDERKLIFHIQFQEFLYRDGLLGKWLEYAATQGAQIVVTFHDRCIPPDFPFYMIDAAICHTQEIYDAIPIDRKQRWALGIPLQPFQVISFGLGRSDEVILRRACEAARVDLIYLNGSQSWIPRDSLIRGIRASDATVLWYPDEPLAGQSFAARVAIGCRRPLVTNRVSWFAGIDYEEHLICDDEPQLARVLEGLRLRSDSYLPKMETMQALAENHLDLYRNGIQYFTASEASA